METCSSRNLLGTCSGPYSSEQNSPWLAIIYLFILQFFFSIKFNINRGPLRKNYDLTWSNQKFPPRAIDALDHDNLHEIKRGAIARNASFPNLFHDGESAFINSFTEKNQFSYCLDSQKDYSDDLPCLSLVHIIYESIYFFASIWCGPYVNCLSLRDYMPDKSNKEGKQCLIKGRTCYDFHVSMHFVAAWSSSHAESMK